MVNKQVLVVLSGGQDSTTALYWALKKFGGASFVETITFDYGQRHSIEIECAKKISAIAGVKNSIIPINTFSALGGNSLTESTISVASAGSTDELPNTFVPGRNLIFLTFAAAYSYQHGINDIVSGVAQTDYSGYPDCRDKTIRSLEKSIELGMDYKCTLHTPLMFKSKADTVRMAIELGAMVAIALTHTCYNGVSPGCRKCPACILRAKGFKDAGYDDPIFQ